MFFVAFGLTSTALLRIYYKFYLVCRIGFEPTPSRFYSGVLPLNYPIKLAIEVTLIFTIVNFVAREGIEPP